MSAALTLAKPEHLDRLVALCAAFHEEEGITQSDDQRRAALGPLVEGLPYGAVYLIGPPRAPIGYIVICFGWSVEFGGLDAIIDELYIRPGVRGRGIASDVALCAPGASVEGRSTSPPRTCPESVLREGPTADGARFSEELCGVLVIGKVDHAPCALVLAPRRGFPNPSRFSPLGPACARPGCADGHCGLVHARALVCRSELRATVLRTAGD